MRYARAAPARRAPKPATRDAALPATMAMPAPTTCIQPMPLAALDALPWMRPTTVIPTVILAIVTAIMWSKSDKRDSVRYDRKADRDGDAELEAYNRNLEALQAAERR